MAVKKIFIVMFALGFVITYIVANHNTANAAVEKQIDDNMTAITQHINKEIFLKTELSYSSNPYDYIKENKDFDSIISLGNDAIPALHKRLSKSPNDGLQEYILAIAIEQISKTDLKKKQSSQWETPKGFSKQWNKHLKELPATVDAITNSQAAPEDKINQIIELGTPAIPFILEKIETGNEELFPAVLELTKNSKVSVGEKSVLNKKEWASKSKSDFINLKNYVLDQQTQD